MLHYQNIFGEMEDRELTAINDIRFYVKDLLAKVAFSGGKDSLVTLHLVKRSGIRYVAHNHYTTVDPPEVTKFIKENYPEIERIRPKASMFQLIEKKGFPPTRQIRYCCEKMKELSGRGQEGIIITGVRKEESVKREGYQMFAQSKTNKKVTYLHPILNWSSEDVWEYIRKYDLKYPVLYDLGYSRVGCIMCPLQNIEGILKDKERYPNFYRAYLMAMQRAIKNKPEIADHFGFKSAEDMMHWWIYQSHLDTETQQQTLSAFRY